MNPRKIKLLILTLMALAMLIWAGNTLKSQPDLSRNYQMAYGFFFFMGCLFVVRGIFALGKK